MKKRMLICTLPWIALALLLTACATPQPHHSAAVNGSDMTVTLDELIERIEGASLHEAVCENPDFDTNDHSKWVDGPPKPHSREFCHGCF